MSRTATFERVLLSSASTFALAMVISLASPVLLPGTGARAQDPVCGTGTAEEDGAACGLYANATAGSVAVGYGAGVNPTPDDNGDPSYDTESDFGAKSEATNTTQVGYGAVANGDNGSAYGFKAQANGARSIAIGSQALSGKAAEDDGTVDTDFGVDCGRRQ
jgi:hypothetical protein